MIKNPPSSPPYQSGKPPPFEKKGGAFDLPLIMILLKDH